MRAKDVMSSGVISLRATATVHEAAELLVNTRVSAMPVLDENGFMVGIVSEADLIQLAESAGSGAAFAPGSETADDKAVEALSARTHAHKVIDIMTKGVVTCDENATLGEVAEVLRSRRIKRVPILRGKAVVGMVSRVDLLQALLSHKPATGVFSPSANAPRSTDEKLRAAVAAALEGQSWSRAQRSDIVVNNGVVHLWGVVPSEAIRAAYREAAAGVTGVKAVETHMQVSRL